MLLDDNREWSARMRIVYVAGFFAPVLGELKRRTKGHIDNRSVVWIPQRSNGDLDLTRFKENFLDVVARGATDVLVCLFLFRGKSYLLDSLKAIVSVGEFRSPDLKVRIEQSKNAYDAAWVLSQIEAFNPSADVPTPNALDELEKWVQRRHNGRVVLHPRAVRGAQESQYGDVKLI